MQNIQPTSDPRGMARLWLGPLLYVLLVSLYFIARFQGQWAEADSSSFTYFIRDVLQHGELIPPGSEVYPNGYAYQAISVMIIGLTGLDPSTLQQLVYPLTTALVVLPAWALYRELTGSARGATFAAALLFTQPEFLFVILRSSHEKFTRVLLLLCLFWLVRSFAMRDRLGALALHVVLFYLCSYALIASNNLLAHSFILAIVVALGAGWALERRVAPELASSGLTRRLQYAAAISLGLVYVFMFYAYQPAKYHLLVFQSLWERIAALVLDVQSKATNPYSLVTSGWVSLPVFFTLSLANWIVLAVSFMLWLRQGWGWLRRSSAPPTQIAWLIWLLYGAFALQGGLSVVADISGALGGNLQHRIFPSFAIIAVALVGGALAEWRPRRPRLAQAALALGFCTIAALSVLKATNEPALSNKWTFYRAAELTALDWSQAHLRDSLIWTEFDERLAASYTMARGVPANGNRMPLTPPLAARSLVVSDITRLRGARLQRRLPLPPDALRVYDNGSAELYRVRPETPYQR